MIACSDFIFILISGMNHDLCALVFHTFPVSIDHIGLSCGSMDIYLQSDTEFCKKNFRSIYKVVLFSNFSWLNDLLWLLY